MRVRTAFLLPARVWMALFFAAPLAIVCAYSFLTRGDYGGVERPATLESFTRLADPLYLAILWRSVWIAGLATALCALARLPARALHLARGQTPRPLPTAGAPAFLDQFSGPHLRLALHPPRHRPRQHRPRAPAPHLRAPAALYNDGAVLLGLVYNFLPFFVLPMYATLERLDPALLEAAADLGARPIATLRRVVIPVSAPGIAAGAVLVFIPCLGAYLTPDLLGGGKSVMLGNLIQNQFTTARDWPFGSAASLVLMLASALLLALLLRSRTAKEFM
jgi:spermidine/putrescine transport system permease protein